MPALLFCLSFSVMFVALGMTATGLGQTLLDNRQTLRDVAGVVLIAMGVLFIGTLFLPLLNREWRPELLLRQGADRRPDRGGPGLRRRVAALHRPDPRRDPHGGQHRGHRRARAACCWPSTRSAWPCRSCSARSPSRRSPASSASSATTTPRSRWSPGVVLIAMGYLLLTNELTRLNSEALQLMDDLGINFFSDI